MKKIIIIVLIGVIIAFTCQWQELHRQTQVIMGTFVEVVSPDPRALPIVFSEFRRIDAMMSKFLPDSEVSRLNRKGWIKASPELFYIISESRNFWEISAGAFDITVGPLMDLWGFTDKKFRVPSEAEIKKVLEVIGSDKIIFDKQESVVKFKIPGMRIDLGGIAKGYAADCAVRKLKDAQIKSCLINSGGQIYALGDNRGRNWKVAIQNPRNPGFSGYLELKNQSAATSGDYEQYFQEGDRRFTHIMDPRTGYPEDSGVISATVIGPDGMTADALSTSIAVLGKVKGLELVKRFFGMEARIIERRDILNARE